MVIRAGDNAGSKIWRGWSVSLGFICTQLMRQSAKSFNYDYISGVCVKIRFNISSQPWLHIIIIWIILTNKELYLGLP